MEKVLEYLKYYIMVIGAGLTWLFGAWDTAVMVLILFMVVDYITGVIKGWYTKELSSDTGLKGLARKFLILLIIMVAVLLDRLLNTGTWVFRTLACYFYIANEGISILENVIVLGLPVPDKLKDALIQLKDMDKKDISKLE